MQIAHGATPVQMVAKGEDICVAFVKIVQRECSNSQERRNEANRIRNHFFFFFWNTISNIGRANRWISYKQIDSRQPHIQSSNEKLDEILFIFHSHLFSTSHLSFLE